MPKYRCFVTYTATKFLGVFEAENEDDAVGQAWDSGNTYVGLCNQCSDEIELDEPSGNQILVEEVDA